MLLVDRMIQDAKNKKDAKVFAQNMILFLGGPQELHS